jgi:exodeoxyribonuclease VII large subunit
MIGLIQTRYHRADNLYRRLRNPNDYLLHIKIQIKNLEQRIHKCISLKVNTCKEKLVYLDKNLLRYHPTQFLRDLSDHLSILEQKLNNRISEILLFKSEQWENNSRLLHAVSPLNTLNRGYAIVLDKHKKLIKNTSDIKVNDRIFTMFEDGGIFSNVDEIQINKKSIK